MFTCEAAMSKTKTHKILIRSYGEGTLSRRRDVLAVEEPLELRVLAGAERRTLGITMRTPGADFELAAGFALSEGIVSDLEQIEGMSYCVDRQQCEEQNFNICLLYTSDAADDLLCVDLGGRRILKQKKQKHNTTIHICRH